MIRATRFAFASLALVACGDPEPLEPTYENVAAVIERSCGGSSDSCHGGIVSQGYFNFGILAGEGRPYTEILVDVPACEYDAMPRIDPGNPANSWMWIKLQNPHDADGEILFDPDPGWDPGLEMRADGTYRPSTTRCSTRVDDDGNITFGLLMPQNPGSPSRLPQHELDMIEEWILMGAPGPSGL